MQQQQQQQDPSPQQPLIGVLALQGAFEEHEYCLQQIGCRTRQVRTIQDLQDIDGIILPGGESTAMGLIGTSTISPVNDSSNNSSNVTTTATTSTIMKKNMWECLQEFDKPIWGTCAGMILLADQCIGTSAVIQNGQALIGGMDICVARNYFGSQISSFEMPIPGPPLHHIDNYNMNDTTFPGVFIRAPAILTVGPDVTILGKVVATPCRQAAITLQELDRKIANGENIIQVGVVDALDRHNDGNGLRYKETVTSSSHAIATTSTNNNTVIQLPGAADDTNAREVICAAQKGNILCTAFHPELTDDYRWHEYFVKQMVLKAKEERER